MITLGGDAELEHVDSLDPFSEGVVFSVRPLKKSWKNIANLSGGEKVFSILVNMLKPCVCLMDCDAPFKYLFKFKDPLLQDLKH
jgi:hypothetical protein